MRSLVLALSFVAATAACKKDEAKPAPAPAPAVAPAAPATTGGPRKVTVEVNKDGYTPAKIAGKPGEKLDLVFTRTFEAECISQVKTPDGKLVDLPMNKPVEVAVTVPPTGQADFACGMDMFHGAIVAQP
jgi:plastocyanin domain-containing protein